MPSTPRSRCTTPVTMDPYMDPPDMPGMDPYAAYINAETVVQNFIAAKEKRDTASSVQT